MEQSDKSMVVLEIESAHVNQETGLSLASQFEPFEQQAKEWKDKALALVVTDVSQTLAMEDARKARIAIRDIRIAVDKKHKELKEDSLRRGQLLDKIKRTLLGYIEPIEKHLLEQESFIQLKEAKERKERQETRTSLLQPFMSDADISLFPLADMDEQAFQQMLEGQKLIHQKRIDDAKKEEKERILNEEKRLAEEKRIREENTKLQKEKDKAEAKLKKEREEKRKLEEENRLREQKEEAERKAKQAEERKLKRAPDKVKIQTMSANVDELRVKLSKVSLQDEEAVSIQKSACDLLSKVSKYLTDNATKL